jgi:O-acetyl-ADP-ribose deacetylase (regulator of RNase III)
MPGISARHDDSPRDTLTRTKREQMLTYLYTSLFDSPAQALVNTVNTEGVMGKGIAKVFREKFPQMYVEYRELCERGELDIGKIHLWKSASRWVLNFPTKTTWRKPSKLEYIEAGLITFVNNYKKMGIVSASFPPLGCGNGNLDWREVRPLIEKYLSTISIPIYVHSLHVGDEFVPEHRETIDPPATFQDFWINIRSAIYENKGMFHTSEGDGPYSAQASDEEISIFRGGRVRERIPFEEIENSWVSLRDGILSIDKFSNDASRRYKSYLFPILMSLPYVRSAAFSRAGQEGTTRAQALYFVRPESAGKDARPPEYRQGWLSL